MKDLKKDNVPRAETACFKPLTRSRPGCNSLYLESFQRTLRGLSVRGSLAGEGGRAPEDYPAMRDVQSVLAGAMTLRTSHAGREESTINSSSERSLGCSRCENTSQKRSRCRSIAAVIQEYIPGAIPMKVSINEAPILTLQIEVNGFYCVVIDPYLVIRPARASQFLQHTLGVFDSA